MTLENVIGVAMIILNIVGLVWLGIKLGHAFLVPLGYIIALIIIGNTNEDACLIVALAVAAIVLIVIIVTVVRASIEKKWLKELARKNTDLVNAINRSDKQSVQAIIENGAYIDYIDYNNYGRYPLQIAIENNDKEMVSFLIEKGANVNLVCGEKSPLDFAKGDEIIAILKSHGAKSQREQDNLNHDFVVAVGCHDVEKAKSLISQISNIDVIDNRLVVEMVGERLDGTGEEQVRKSEATPLIYSVWNDDIEMVKLLLENGANTEIRDSHDKTALMYAAMHFGAEHNVEILEFLISKGANVSAMCSDPADNIKYVTPLMFATISGDVDSVRALIKNGADVNAKAFRGLDSVTALGCAKYCGFTEIETHLRKSGARD
ncbi:MAG: ankyrin repeat domain-containing protein [Treponema sp.]|nr:ankyrin repeat domain-containing protein [Treponema sp.]